MEELTMSTALLIIAGVTVTGIIAAALASAVFTVETGTREIVQRFGKFLVVANPGLNFKVPFIDQIADDEPMDMRVQQSEIVVEAKTKDDVFLHVALAIQYQVEDPERAFYRLDDPKEQIKAYVNNVVRGEIPHADIAGAFESKDELSTKVKDELSDAMSEFGYSIISVLVTDIVPPTDVKHAMNAIIASQRQRIAAEAQGEANKILVVKAAEAEAESKTLQGKGIAGQRKAIVDGLKESVRDFSEAAGIDTKEVMVTILMTQYFDTLKEIGGEGSVTFLPHSPGGMTDLWAQFQGALKAGRE